MASQPIPPPDSDLGPASNVERGAADADIARDALAGAGGGIAHPGLGGAGDGSGGGSDNGGQDGAGAGIPGGGTDMRMDGAFDAGDVRRDREKLFPTSS